MVGDHYNALTRTAGFLERSDRGRFAVSGADRADYLQGQLTNDIAALADQQGCYAVYLTPQGRMVADMEVLHLGEQLLLDVHISVRDFLIARFEALVFTEDVEITDWTVAAGYLVSGPSAAACVSTALVGLGAPSATSIAQLGDHECQRFAVGETSIVVARTDPLGSWGLEVWVEQSADDVVKQSLVAAGCTEVDRASAEIVRIENGRPVFPVDLTSDTIPLEAGIEGRAMSFTKGCYVGQEVITRILHRGHGRVARRLTGLTIDTSGPAAPLSGSAIFDGDKEVGRITSAAVSPAVGKVIALGYVSRALLEPGISLEVQLGSERLSAVVTEPLFHRHPIAE